MSKVHFILTFFHFRVSIVAKPEEVCVVVGIDGGSGGGRPHPRHVHAAAAGLGGGRRGGQDPGDVPGGGGGQRGEHAEHAEQAAARQKGRQN